MGCLPQGSVGAQLVLIQQSIIPAFGNPINKYSLRWLSRTMSGGAHDSVRPPRPGPLLPSIVSFWAGYFVETSAEPTCDGGGRDQEAPLEPTENLLDLMFETF